MIVYAVYIITEDGRPLVWQIFQTPDYLPPEGLISPLLSTIQGLSVDLMEQQGTAEKFTLAGLTYHMKWFGEYFVVLVMETDNKPTQTLNQIGMRFLQEYKIELKSWKGDISEFEPFKESLVKILEPNYIIDASQSINPTKKLNTKALFNLEKSLKDTAIAMVGLKRATAREVADYIKEDLEIVTERLEKLRNLGYLGTKEEEAQTVYFF